MTVSLTETIHELGKALLEQCRNGEDISEALRNALASFLGPLSPFAIDFVGVKSPAGQVLIERELIIYTRAPEEPIDLPRFVTCESVAGVFYVTKLLDEKSLVDGYSVIGKVKALPRRKIASDDG